MECAESELAERYVKGLLTEEEQKSFEEHYFACDRCFALLEAHRALQAELFSSAPPVQARPAAISAASRWKGAAAMAAAVAAVMILSVLAIRWGAKPHSVPPQIAQTMKPSPTGPSLAELARFDPPAYTPMVFRGAQSEPVPKFRTAPPAIGRRSRDEATQKFRLAMNDYQQGDYARAITGLQAARQLNPEEPGTIFFLGVSHLLVNQTNDGIAILQQTVALGDTPYLEEAHYYLAKAFLRNSDPAAAEAELQQTVELKGELESKAQTLLQAVEALRKRSQ